MRALEGKAVGAAWVPRISFYADAVFLIREHAGPPSLTNSLRRGRTGTPPTRCSTRGFGTSVGIPETSDFPELGFGPNFGTPDFPMAQADW